MGTDKEKPKGLTDAVPPRHAPMALPTFRHAVLPGFVTATQPPPSVRKALGLGGGRRLHVMLGTTDGYFNLTMILVAIRTPENPNRIQALQSWPQVSKKIRVFRLAYQECFPGCVSR
jgi:hypothetical protein